MRLQGVGDQEFRQYGMQMLTPAQLSNMAGNSSTTQTSNDGMNISQRFLASQMVFVVDFHS